jgi:hypothetical protein
MLNILKFQLANYETHNSYYDDRDCFVVMQRKTKN